MRLDLSLHTGFPIPFLLGHFVRKVETVFRCMVFSAVFVWRENHFPHFARLVGLDPVGGDGNGFCAENAVLPLHKMKYSVFNFCGKWNHWGK